MKIPSSFSFCYDNADFGRAETSVWWDIRHCPVPRDCNAAAVPLYLQNAIRHIGCLGPITIFTDTTCIHPSTYLCLGYNQHLFRFVAAKYTSDEMVEAMREWANRNPAPATCLLITADKCFSSILDELRLKGYNVCLGHPGEEGDPSLTKSASFVWKWSSLAYGGDPRSSSKKREREEI